MSSKLGKRELEVVQAAGEGLTLEETAELLYISRYTVKNHLANATEKLGAKNRTHLVALAIRSGEMP